MQRLPMIAASLMLTSEINSEIDLVVKKRSCQKEIIKQHTCRKACMYSQTPGLRTWVLGVRVLSYVQMWYQMWVLKPNQDS